MFVSRNCRIIYNGLTSEWSSISLDEYWYTSTLDFVIHCSDDFNKNHKNVDKPIIS